MSQCQISLLGQLFQLYLFLLPQFGCNFANGDMVGHTGVYTAIEQAVKAGKQWPGYKLVDKRPTRKWNVDDHTVEKELSTIGLAESDIYCPREVKSPAQIEKVIGKAKKNADKLAFVETLCEKVSSGTKLVHESEPGDPVKRSAQEDFKDA